MIAQAGLLSYRTGFTTPMGKSTCTQRYMDHLDSGNRVLTVFQVPYG